MVIFSKINNDQKNTLEIEKSLNLKEGEVVLIPSRTLHWHRITDNHDSSQISFLNNSKTDWF